MPMLVGNESPNSIFMYGILLDDITLVATYKGMIDIVWALPVVQLDEIRLLFLNFFLTCLK